jgi:phage tail-like protein
MSPTIIRPYDFILEPTSLFDDPEQLRPFRVVAPAEPLRLFTVEDGALQLKPNEAARPPLADPKGSFGGLALARGVAVWCDTLFFADPARQRVLYWRPCTGTPQPLPGVAAPARPEAPPTAGCLRPVTDSPGERELHTPIALAISARDDLVVVDAGHRRLLLFALPGFALRRIIRLPAKGGEGGDAFWRPIDAAAGPRGHLYVADADGYIWRLDPQGRPDPLYGGALPAGVVPRRIAVDGDGRVYLLAEARNVIFVLDRYGRFLTTGDPPAPLQLTSIDQSAGSGGPAVRDVLGPAPLSLDRRELIMASGREHLRTGLMVDDGGRLVLDNHPDPPYAHYVPPPLTYPQAGALIVELDSRHFGNAWHRVVVERSVVERTGLQLFSLTSEQEQIGLDAAALLGPAWKVAPVNATEWLVQSPPGRYLYLGIEMIGPGDRTPALQRAYLYRERDSSLAFLPATFQADPTSRSVLDRFLSLFDTIYAELEMTIDEFAFLLDVDSTRPEFAASFLPWLASWFGLLLEQTWSEAQKRAFLRQIMYLYRWRGTLKGIVKLVELHTGVPSPRVIEHYAAWRAVVVGEGVTTDAEILKESQVRLRDWLNAPGIEAFDAPALKQAEPRHHFTILLPGYALANSDRLATLHRLLEAYIPAHTHYTLRRLPDRGFRLSYTRADAANSRTPGVIVGLDTVLGSPSQWRVSPEMEPERRLGTGTVLPAAAGPQGLFQLGGVVLRRPPHRRSICPSCQNC